MRYLLILNIFDANYTLQQWRLGRELATHVAKVSVHRSRVADNPRPAVLSHASRSREYDSIVFPCHVNVSVNPTYV